MYRIVFILVLALTACSKDSLMQKTPIISFVELDEQGVPMYNVKFSDGTGIDYMYKEEIKRGLKTGVWQYNEDLLLSK